MDGSDWALVITAVLTGLAAVATAVAAIISAKAKGDDECQTKLKAAWAESEHYAEQLHSFRTEGIPDDAGP